MHPFTACVICFVLGAVGSLVGTGVAQSTFDKWLMSERGYIGCNPDGGAVINNITFELPFEKDDTAIGKNGIVDMERISHLCQTVFVPSK